MKLLITGATGFLGSHLIEHMLTCGHEIVILKRSFSNTYRLRTFIDQLQVYDIDQCDLEQPFKDHGKIDAVIHTATSYGRKGENTCNIFNSNTMFPLRILEIASQFHTDMFFNADTALYKYLNDYSLSKQHFVEWGYHFAVAKKIRFINIKLEHMYGLKDDDSKFSTYIIKSCLMNAPELRLTLGNQKRDFIYIDDVLSAYEILLEKANYSEDYFQEYEVGSGQVVTIREFVEMVHAFTQSKTQLNFGAISYREHEVMESCAKLEKLLQLGWKPSVSLVEGLCKIINDEKCNLIK